mmetsp:Transcript_60638/g.113270  ORF Transcript_60638/g.113270 Transcript_60638/m.113270 type:complete len:249 (+) Transcript_60638:633-1379(+)
MPSPTPCTTLAPFVGSDTTYSPKAFTLPGTFETASAVLATVVVALVTPLPIFSGSSIIPLTVDVTPSTVDATRDVIVSGILDTFSMMFGGGGFSFLGLGACKAASFAPVSCTLLPASAATLDTSLKGSWNFSPSSCGTAFRFPKLSLKRDAWSLMEAALFPTDLAVSVAARAAFPGASTTSWAACFVWSMKPFTSWPSCRAMSAGLLAPSASRAVRSLLRLAPSATVTPAAATKAPREPRRSSPARGL